MIPAVELERRLGASRRRLLATLEAFDEAEFTTRPPRGGWSAGHVCEHIARVDDSVLRTARRQAAGAPDPGPRFADHLRRLPLVLGVARWVRVRTGSALDPAEAPERGAALERLAVSRAALLTFLDEHRDADLSRWTSRHPFFGRMGLDRMIAFVTWHEDRHRRQIERARAALSRRR